MQEAIDEVSIQARGDRAARRIYYHRCRIEPNVVVVGLTMDFRSQDTRLDPILYI